MVINTENLTLSLSGGDKPLFRDISFKLDEGEKGLITGGAGSGKTLLGLTLCGFLPLWVGDWKLGGQIEVLGKPLAQGEYRDELGIVLENPYTQISGIKGNVLEEMAFPLECRGIKQKEMHDLICRYANALGIPHLLKRKINNISGGELQRVIIACTLIAQPRFLFLDRLMTEIDIEFRPHLFYLIHSHIKEVGGSALIAEDPWLLPDGKIQKKIELSPGKEETYVSDTALYKSSEKKIESTGENLLSVESLCFNYENGNPVLEDLSFSLDRGEVLFLTGANGSGKTTLASIIAGIIRPSSGNIILEGKTFQSMNQWEIMSLVGLSLQNPGFYLCRSTVRKEIEFAEQWGNSPEKLADILGLEKLMNNHPLELTQAEKKRLGVALSYGKRKKIIILDEPSQYQDQEGFKRMEDAIKRIIAEEKTIIIITHDPRFFGSFPDSKIIHLSPVNSY